MSFKRLKVIEDTKTIGNRDFRHTLIAITWFITFIVIMSPKSPEFIEMKFLLIIVQILIVAFSLIVVYRD